MQRIFHRPVRAHRRQEPLRTEPVAEKEESGLRAPLPLDLPRRGDLFDGLQAGPVMQFLQRVDVVADDRLADLDAPVALPTSLKRFNFPAFSGSTMWSRTSTCSVSWLPFSART